MRHGASNASNEREGRVSRRWLIMAAVAAVGSACTEVPPSNPYDPSAPAVQQKKGQVTGEVVLPEGFGPDRFVEAQAELRRPTAPTEMAYSTFLGAAGETDAGGPVEDAGATDGGLGVAARGRFHFGDVEPGGYTVRVAVRGFALYEKIIEVSLDSVVDLGEVELALVQRAAISGRAMLAGAAVGEHQGIVVQALRTPFFTLTTDDGQFRLPVAAGRYELRPWSSFRPSGQTRARDPMASMSGGGGAWLLPRASTGTGGTN